jgi:RNA polymerase sigma-70 factor, ECF subfamily
MTLDAEFDAVLAAAQLGADWAVALLYRDLHPRLLRYLRAQAPQVAEDLASDVWMAVARRLASFEGNEDALRAWVFTIARRQVIGHWRQTGRRRTDLVAPDVLVDRAGGDDPEAIVVADMTAQEAIASLVAELPPDQAQVVLLRVVAGLDVAEVAEIMGKRPGTVRVLQHRALRQLAAKLSREVVTR